jgi:hypothetical protein
VASTEALRGAQPPERAPIRFRAPEVRWDQAISITIIFAVHEHQSAYSSLFSLSLNITLDVASASFIATDELSLKSRFIVVPA